MKREKLTKKWRWKNWPTKYKGKNWPKNENGQIDQKMKMEKLIKMKGEKFIIKWTGKTELNNEKEKPENLWKVKTEKKCKLKK